MITTPNGQRKGREGKKKDFCRFTLSAGLGSVDDRYPFRFCNPRTSVNYSFGWNLKKTIEGISTGGKKIKEGFFFVVDKQGKPWMPLENDGGRKTEREKLREWEKEREIEGPRWYR